MAIIILFLCAIYILYFFLKLNNEEKMNNEEPRKMHLFAALYLSISFCWCVQYWYAWRQ